MARPKKSDRLFKPEKGKIKVRSKAYGDHERAARGTYTEAKINTAMETHGERLRQSNNPAKLIHDNLKPFRENFKGGLFWQFLIKHFAAQAKKNEKYSIVDIWAPMDVNKEYPMYRLMDTMSVREHVDKSSLSMQVNVQYKLSERFMGRSHYKDGTQVTIIIMFPDFENNEIEVVSNIMPIRKLNDTDTYSFIINIPVSATSYLIFCKAEATEKGEVASSIATKALQLMKGRELD
jgi:hypothetical protein